MRSSNIVIVGNAIPKEDYSEFIESHDIVIRFNHVNFLHTKKLGNKCDILVVQNMDSSYREGKATFDKWEKLIIIAENEVKDYSALIINSNNWKTRNIETIYSDNLPVREKLNNGGSSGFIILEWLLNSKKEDLIFPISLVCFTWQGWEGHAWEQEKKICHEYQKLGLVDIV